MSKLTETLHRTVSRKEMGGTVPDEIARTYFKMPEKEKHEKKKRVPKMPWIIAGLALLVSVIVLISKSSIDVRIRILSEVPSADIKGQRPSSEQLRGKGIFLVNGSQINKDSVMSASFEGDAKVFSRVASNQLVLCNARGSGWANYRIELREPVDLSKLDLKYTAKGAKGLERIAIVIVDADNRSYRVEKDMFTTLTGDWQTYTINFRPLKNAIDLTSILTIKFEVGSLTAGNDLVTTVFIKDIYVAKTKRIPWL